MLDKHVKKYVQIEIELIHHQYLHHRINFLTTTNKKQCSLNNEFFYKAMVYFLSATAPQNS